MGKAAGAVVDLGAGAGRHSLSLQDLGHEVAAVDSSPGAVAVCRSRGIRDVRLADLRRLGTGRRWETVLLMCGNLGLAGDREPTRRLLTRLAAMTTTGGLLIGDSVDPVSDDPHVRLRLHYGALTSPWWDQINIPPSEMEPLVEGTGWRLEERVGGEDGYAVVLRRR
ncbi:MAG TPA: methyltransferase domain-containing protein [Actinomycetota bacterium]|nr:methyltransferase domain-containing protein [Actinomycetota bacterium]